MNRYQNGKIYQVVDVGYNKCYIGSTCESLSKRMDRHRRTYKTYLKTGKVDTNTYLLFDEFGVENCKIILLENYPCESKDMLVKKESEYQQSMDCINKRVEGRTCNEYYKDYRDDILENKKEKIGCSCGSSIRKHEIRRHERSKKHQEFLEQK